MVVASTVSESVAPGTETARHESVLLELQAVSRVRTVVVTDQHGAVTFTSTRGEDRRVEAEHVDVLMGATHQAMQGLTLGKVQVLTSVCEAGTLVVACAASSHVAILADTEANLGTLLNHARRFLEGNR